MKSEGVHISLCCEHCHLKVPLTRVDFKCPHCENLCEANFDVADTLQHIAQRIQAMTPAQLQDMLAGKKQPQVKCTVCSGRGFTRVELPEGKKIVTKRIVCSHCHGKGEVPE